MDLRYFFFLFLYCAILLDLLPSGAKVNASCCLERLGKRSLVSIRQLFCILFLVWVLIGFPSVANSCVESWRMTRGILYCDGILMNDVRFCLKHLSDWVRFSMTGLWKRNLGFCHFGIVCLLKFSRLDSYFICILTLWKELTSWLVSLYLYHYWKWPVLTRAWTQCWKASRQGKDGWLESAFPWVWPPWADLNLDLPSFVMFKIRDKLFLSDYTAACDLYRL